MKKALHGGLVLVIVLVGASTVTLAEGREQTLERDIRELLEVTGTSSMADQMMDQLFGHLKQADPGVPAEFWTRFAEKVDTDELIEMIVPIYVRHFTHEEVRALLEFYRSPIGQKVLARMPVVMQESMLAGQQWGEQIGLEVAKELEAEGYQ